MENNPTPWQCPGCGTYYAPHVNECACRRKRHAPPNFPAANVPPDLWYLHPQPCPTCHAPGNTDKLLAELDAAKAEADALRQQVLLFCRENGCSGLAWCEAHGNHLCKRVPKEELGKPDAPAGELPPPDTSAGALKRAMDGFADAVRSAPTVLEAGENLARFPVPVAADPTLLDALAAILYRDQSQGMISAKVLATVRETPYGMLVKRAKSGGLDVALVREKADEGGANADA
jgi:hypothetical protein